MSDGEISDDYASGSGDERRPADHYTGVRPTPEQETTMADLRARNASLRQQLRRLNGELDRQLEQHGQKTTRVLPMPRSAAQMSPVERRAAQNEALRRRIAELQDRVHAAQAADRVQEVQNDWGAVTAQYEALRDEQRSLENIHRNQMVIVEAQEQAAQEMAALRAQHHSEQRQLKDAMRRAKDEREEAAAQHRALVARMDRLEEKLRSQEAAGPSVLALDEMQRLVEERDHVVESLKYQVAVLSRTNVSDKKRARIRGACLGRQLEALREEHRALSERAAKRTTAEDLAGR